MKDIKIKIQNSLSYKTKITSNIFSKFIKTKN